MKKLFYLVVILAFVGLTAQAQAILIVDNNQGAGAPYTSVQAAINAAQPGDHIYVQPSPNQYDNINLTKQLNIYGIGHNPQLNAGQYAYINSITFNGAAGGTKISGLVIGSINFNYGFNNHGVVITNNYIFGTITGNGQTDRVNDVVISGNYFVHNSTNFIDNVSSQNWIISNNLFERQGTAYQWNMLYRLNNTTIVNNNIFLSRQNGDTNQSVTVFESCSGTQISNNIFLFTGTNIANMNLGNNTALTFNNNLTYSVSTALTTLGGTNINDVNPQFVSWNANNTLGNTTHDYNIQGGSPAENAGTDGNDLGIMNGAFPFSLRGYPTELPYLTDFVIFNNIISAGTDLNINVKANANTN